MKKLLKAVLVLPLLWIAMGCGPKAQPAQSNPNATPPASQPVPSAVPGAPPA